MFINESYVIGLGLEVEAFGEAMCGLSSLGCRVRVDMTGQSCESKISVILLMVDLLVVDISGLMSFLTWMR